MIKSTLGGLPRHAHPFSVDPAGAPLGKRPPPSDPPQDPSVEICADGLVEGLKRRRVPNPPSRSRKSNPAGINAHVDPASRSRASSETAALALSQTTAARNVLYAPGLVLGQELGAAAAVLHALASRLGPEHLAALGARLLGKQGLLPGQPPQVLLDTLARVREDLHVPNERRATGLDRAVVLALMGDIGALYADTGATTGVESRSREQAESLRVHLRRLMVEHGLSGPDEAIIRAVQRVGGSTAVGPLKQTERTRPGTELVLRNGVHDTGGPADHRLRITKDQRIPGSRSNVAHISNERVAHTTEPLVGHMSGSPAEILHVWDMLLKDPPDAQYLGTLKNRDPGNWDPLSRLSPERQDRQRARVAGASAFLVGLGYHSTVEIAEGALAYMGQNLRAVLDSPAQDAGHLLGHGAATSLMTELFESQSIPRELL